MGGVLLCGVAGDGLFIEPDFLIQILQAALPAAALLQHLEEMAPRASSHRVDTVYFGGGTPSYLGVKRLKKLLKTVKKRYPVEKTA